MKRLFAALGGVVVVVAAVVLLRAVWFKSRQVQVPPAPALGLDETTLAQRLSRAVQLPTVSTQDPAARQREPFDAFHAFLQQSYPRVHASLQRQIIDEHSLLYIWRGTEPALDASVFLAHMDVVPVDDTTLPDWKHPPFSGAIADGAVWGRGSIDDKSGLLATMEAAEILLAQQFVPRRTIVLAFGHDEEVIGAGARQVAETLKSLGIRPAFVIDEGLAVTRGLMPGVDAPVALVGMAQKGYLTLELVAEGEGGHSSMPPSETQAGILARAVHRLETSQMPAHVPEVVRQLFAFVGAEMAVTRRIPFANMWLFGPVVRQMLLKKPSNAALIRTTTAPTMLEGSVKENVLATRARAVVNFRILPGDSIEGVKGHVARVVDDPRIRVQSIGTATEPSPQSPVDSPRFAMVQRTIMEVAPDAVVAPGLVLSATDARHYEGVTPDIYRFRPYTVTAEDLARVHGTNERLRVSDYVRMVTFDVQLMRNADQVD